MKSIQKESIQESNRESAQAPGQEFGDTPPARPAPASGAFKARKILLGSLFLASAGMLAVQVWPSSDKMAGHSGTLAFKNGEATRVEVAEPPMEVADEGLEEGEEEGEEEPAEDGAVAATQRKSAPLGTVSHMLSRGGSKADDAKVWGRGERHSGNEAAAMPGGVVGGVPGGVVGGLVGAGKSGAATGAGYGIPGQGFGGRGARVRRVKQARARIRGSQARPMMAPARPDYDQVKNKREFRPTPHSGGDKLQKPIDLEFVSTRESRFSTMSTDVDTANYSRFRGDLRSEGEQYFLAYWPEKVRIEEWINYFQYRNPKPQGEHPVALSTELSQSPWANDRQLLRVSVAAKEGSVQDDPQRNLVFLLDVSGSMSGPEGLGRVKSGLSHLVSTLTKRDRVSIVVYAGASGVVLRPTRGDQKDRILAALQRLEAGGSTNGGQGIELAYRYAQKHFVKGGINRVILATDGDFNVGTTGERALVKLIEKKRKSGVYLSVLGVGSSMHSDQRMEAIADHGNGNYAYLDSEREARRVLLQQARKTLVPVADDVKVQLEFDPKQVSAYRLIGYQNRQLARRDFKNDKKDAGELGAGHASTVFYELKLKPEADPAQALATLRARYKLPGQRKSRALSREVGAQRVDFADASEDFRFASAVTLFAQVVEGKLKSTEIARAHRIALDSLGEDRDCERSDFVNLMYEYTRAKGLERKVKVSYRSCEVDGESILADDWDEASEGVVTDEIVDPEIVEPKVVEPEVVEAVTPPTKTPAPVLWVALPSWGEALPWPFSWMWWIAMALRELPLWVGALPGLVGFGVLGVLGLSKRVG